MASERIGVIVKVEENWVVVSLISPTSGQDTFEVQVKLDASSKTPKLGSWIMLRSDEKNVYRIALECKEFLPTQVCNGLVMLQTPIYFQAKGQEGYGEWVWAPALGRVTALCHDRYNPHQAYVALVARTPAKYRAFVEYNWMLTKHILESNSVHNFLKGANDHDSGDIASGSNSSPLHAVSNAGPFDKQLTQQVEQQTILNKNTETPSALQMEDTNTTVIEIFRGVVTILNNVLVVVEPRGRLGFLKHNQCDVPTKNLEVGDWVAVAGQRRLKTKQYDIVGLPSVIKAEVKSCVKKNTVMLLSTIRIEKVKGNDFYASSPIFGNVVGAFNITSGESSWTAWCTPRARSNFELYWEAVELKNRSTEDGKCCDIYSVISRVISNPVVRATIKNYRPKELLSIDKAMGLKFDR